MQSNTKQWVNQVKLSHTLKEIELLESLYPTLKYKKWKIIADEFTKNGFQRSQNQLKLKWKYINDTSNDHKKWTYQELKIIYESVFYEGSNWSIIRKRLKGRSCMKLKNTFYSSMRKFLRRLLDDIHGQEQSYNLKDVQILPSTCLRFFCGQDEFSNVSDMILSAFMRLDYDFCHSSFERFKDCHNELFLKICDVIKQHFESIYIINDQKKKDSKSSISEDNSDSIKFTLHQVIDLTYYPEKMPHSHLQKNKQDYNYYNYNQILENNNNYEEILKDGQRKNFYKRMKRASYKSIPIEKIADGEYFENRSACDGQEKQKQKGMDWGNFEWNHNPNVYFHMLYPYINDFNMFLKKD